MTHESENPGALAGATGVEVETGQFQKEQYGNTPAFVHARNDEIRDLILIALDATESPDMTDRNRLEARAALAEALDLLEGEG